jgi:hypothetical protein
MHRTRNLHVPIKKATALIAVAIAAAVILPTDHVDRTNQSWTAQETILTPANVVGGNFGKRGSYSTDGYGYAQPLYIPSSASGLTQNLIIAATMHNSIYAFDADRPGVTIWHAGPLTTSQQYPYVNQDNPGLFYNLEIGCLGTPVADTVNKWLFVVCANNTPDWILYKLNLLTGATIASTTVAGQVVGTGDPIGGDTTSGPNLLFYPKYELQRTGIALSNGKIYFGFASMDDVHPWHGWLFAYDESLNQTAIFCTSPNGYGGGVWHSQGKPAFDGSGNVYIVSGNGDYDGSSNFGQSALKLSASLSVLDWFTPTDWATLNLTDKDMGSGRPMLLASDALVVFGAKNYKVYSLSTSCMGHLGGTVGGCSPQILTTNGSGTSFGIFGEGYFNGTAYFGLVGNDSVYAYSLSGTTFNSSPTISALTFPFPAAQPTFSSAPDASNGIMWTVRANASAHVTAQAGTLYALDPATMTSLWNSGSGADALGTMVKFSSPTVAAGKVFVSTSNAVVVYGIGASSVLKGSAILSGSATLH